MLIFRQNGPLMRCVGRCDGPGTTPKWQGNTALWAVPGDPVRIFKIRNDVKRPEVDSIPIAAVVLDENDDPTVLPGWRSYAN